MELQYPTATYSLALVDGSLLVTSGNQLETKEGEEVESLRYQPPTDLGIQMTDEYLTIDETYQAILDQTFPPGLRNQKITVQDLEFVFYRGQPYLAYSPSKLLLVRVPDSLAEVLDPSVEKKYVTTLFHHKLYICQLTSLNRIAAKSPMKLEDGVTLTFIDEKDGIKRLENSYFQKYGEKIYLRDCYLTSKDDHIIMVTEKISANFCCTLASVPHNFG